MGKQIYPNFPSKTWIQNVLTKHVLQLTRVDGPILMTNSPREQKKNKINVCSILVNRKKIYNLTLSDWMVFGKFLKFYYRGGHVDVARLTSFHHKKPIIITYGI
jgi:hypothetical protein